MGPGREEVFGEAAWWGRGIWGQDILIFEIGARRTAMIGQTARDCGGLVK